METEDFRIQIDTERRGGLVPRQAPNLNRMTTSPPLVSGGSLSAWTYEHDILGNRTRRNASTNNHAHPMRYDWDVLNRATLIAQPSGGAGYAYRADGQRIEKAEGITFSWSGSRESGQYDTNYDQNRPTSRYYYDGQMGFEDDYNPAGTVNQVNHYALGARGIDRVARTESGNTTLAYPMYDGHGNMRALLTRDGTSYSTGNWKTYEVWGSVRSGGSSADPKQGYVASIGHVADDESSLIYMRARYYEPAIGRFLSEDPARDGTHWYAYCGNAPTAFVDNSGNSYAPPAWFGPWANYLWLFSFLSNTIAVTSTLIGLAVFAGAMEKAEDGLAVELAFGMFMDNFNKGVLQGIEPGGNASRSLVWLRWLLQNVNSVGRHSGATSVFQTVTTGAQYGALLAMLCIAHSIRVQWYINDIH